MAALGRETLVSLFHHIVLPRHVPGRADRNIYGVESELARRLTRAVKALATHAHQDDLRALDDLRLTISGCAALNVDGKIDKQTLTQELRQLNGGRAVVLHVTEQNAALLVYPHSSTDGHTIVFEVFETSATSEHVLEAENALVWDFPGQAIAIPRHIVMDDDFQHSLSTFLEQASVESIKRFSAVTYKACAPLPEVRNTPDPTLISGALMAILEAYGSAHETTLLRKRVRDTVSFDNASTPWRRSAFYLVLRVAIQRHLYNLLGFEKGRLYYKLTMCLFMCQFLRDGLYVLPHEALHLLRQKLGRRLSKLSLDHDRGSEGFKHLHTYVSRTLRKDFKETLVSVGQAIETQWEVHKRRTTRRIQPIQPYAEATDMVLDLSRSGPYLFQAMQLALNATQTEYRSASDLLGHYENSKAPKPFNAITKRFLPLFIYEETVKTMEDVSISTYAARCSELAESIQSYVSTARDVYADYPEFRSRQLLSLLSLWMQMDIQAVRCYPLLAEYHPFFEAEMLNVLQLSTLDELERLHDLQEYISMRCNALHSRVAKTIFDTPAEDTFAARYFDESHESMVMKQLREQIEEDAQDLLDDKEEEWEEKSDAHESKIREMAGLSCVYITEIDERGIEQQVHKKPCRKHRLKWEAKQISIGILEHPLPKFEPARKAIIFELSCPKPFAAYRDATWLILSTFAFPAAEQTTAINVPADDFEPQVIRAYSGLKDYANTTKCNITLGSTTKSHLESHYSVPGFPVDFAGICRAFGLRLDYYDAANKSFTKREVKPSFAHLFPLKLPPSSPYLNFEDMLNTTSNRILATQTRCPTDVNLHEYVAWQNLLLGSYVRWPSLLRELGSTNLSFSTDSTWAAISRVLLQAGPLGSGGVFRETHSILQDPLFCGQLLHQIDYRLEAIRRNCVSLFKWIS